MADERYPIVVMQDRYNGSYSGGRWLAVAEASELVDVTNTRAQFCLVSDDGPSGGDIEARIFWENPPKWIAVGATPDEAIKALEADATKPLIRAYAEHKDI